MSDDNSNAGKTLFINSLWAIFTRVAMRFLGAISIVILARILVPEDYGLIALAMMIMTVLETMTAMGLEAALVADQKATKDHYNTVWTLHVIQGLVIGLALAALAVPSANYFDEPELEMVLYSYAALTVVYGFFNVGIVDFRKKLRFELEFKFLLYSKLISFFVTIAAAIILKSYWALIIGVTANYFVKLVLSYTMSPFRPKFCLKKWRELFNFSKWMIVHTVSSSITWEADSFLVARLANTQTLGVFSIADELAQTPTVELGTSVSRAMSPSLAKLNDNEENFKALYHLSLGMLLFVAAPAGVGISVLAQEFTAILLGEKWQDAVPFIEILALVGVLSLFPSSSISALVNSGRVKVLACLSVVRLFVRTSLLFAGFYYFGINGFLWATLISIILYSLISLSAQRHYGLISFKKLFSMCWRSLVATAFMYFFLKAIQNFLYTNVTHNEWIVSGVIVVAGIMSYGTCILTLWSLSGKGHGPENEFMNYIKSKRKSYSTGSG